LKPRQSVSGPARADRPATGGEPHERLQPHDQHDDWRRRAGRTRRERSEQAILTAARTLFERHSYDQVSVESIAAVAGVAPGTVYNRFGSKGAIAAALLTGWLEPLEQSAQADIDDGLDIRRALPRHFARLGGLIDAERPLAEALFLAVIEHGQRFKIAAEATDPRRIMPLPNPLLALLTAAQRRNELRPGLDLDDLARIATAFLATRVLAREEPATRSGAFIAELMLDGIAVPAGRRR
jgi:AcrR family transcriptional regulator